MIHASSVDESTYPCPVRLCRWLLHIHTRIGYTHVKLGWGGRPLRKRKDELLNTLYSIRTEYIKGEVPGCSASQISRFLTAPPSLENSSRHYTFTMSNTVNLLCCLTPNPGKFDRVSQVSHRLVLSSHSLLPSSVSVQANHLPLHFIDRCIVYK